MSDDVGDEVQVKQRKRQLEDERCREEFREVLLTPGGRYWVWRLLSYCGVFQTTSEHDINIMAIRSGMRDAGLWALEEVFKSSPKAFNLMQQESKERENG